MTLLSLSERLERLIDRAGAYKNWWAVRMCSALLGKLVDSLAPSITSMLVRGKQVGMIQLGRIFTYLYDFCIHHLFFEL